MDGVLLVGDGFLGLVVEGGEGTQGGLVVAVGRGEVEFRRHLVGCDNFNYKMESSLRTANLLTIPFPVLGDALENSSNIIAK